MLLPKPLLLTYNCWIAASFVASIKLCDARLIIHERVLAEHGILLYDQDANELERVYWPQVINFALIYQ
jgi:hypothetical protein